MSKDPFWPACPICGKPRSERFRPFCSSRCADADLQGWLSDRYVIPVGDDEEQPGLPEASEVAGQHSRRHL